MTTEIMKKIEDKAEREALKLLDEANADYRNHQIWKLLGINPEELPGAVEKLGQKSRYNLNKLAALKQDLEQKVDEQVPEARVVQASLAGLNHINLLKI